MVPELRETVAPAKTAITKVLSLCVVGRSIVTRPIASTTELIAAVREIRRRQTRAGAPEFSLNVCTRTTAKRTG